MTLWGTHKFTRQTKHKVTSRTVEPTPTVTNVFTEITHRLTVYQHVPHNGLTTTAVFPLNTRYRQRQVEFSARYELPASL